MKIIYVVPFAYPSSSANSLRVKGMIDALVLAGHEVEICAGISNQTGQDNCVNSEGLNVYCVNEYKKGLFAQVHAGMRGLFLGNNTLHWLQSLQQKPDVIVLYGTHLGYLLRLLPFCKRHGIRLLLDVVEWYDPRHLPGGFFGPFALSNELSMRFFAKKVDGIFVISRYLEQHFSGQGCKTLRVPPMFSIQQARPPQFREVNGLLNICYVGSPGKKEDFLSIFYGLQIAYDAGCRFVMHIVGVTAREFKHSYGLDLLSILKIDGVVQFYGRVANIEAKRIVASCDFLVVLRKNERFVQAGFPSKVAESLCLGTPIMANLMSNLDEYLIEDENSIIVTDVSAVGFSMAIRHANQLKKEQYISIMQKKALDTGQLSFAAQTYATAMDTFISEIVKR